jgi:hypothetical protein
MLSKPSGNYFFSRSTHQCRVADLNPPRVLRFAVKFAFTGTRAVITVRFLAAAIALLELAVVHFDIHMAIPDCNGLSN